jgi:hypothetical protein
MRTMTDSPHLTAARQRRHAARDERLARALRDNLHRRKDQARARQPQSAPVPQPQRRDEPPA